MPDDFIIRLSRAGGPTPEAEILFSGQRAQQYGQTWVGPRCARNAAWIRDGTSLASLTSGVRRRKTVLRGIVREVTNRRPDDELLGVIYWGHDFAWWGQLDSVECVVSDFDALALRKIEGTPYNTGCLSIRQVFNYLQREVEWPSDAVKAGDVDSLDDTSDSDWDLVAQRLTEEGLAFVVPKLVTSASTGPGTTIHAIDWSGGGDFRAANKKIRYAQWAFTAAGSTVNVLPAGLSRSEVLALIRTMPGLWVLDFPFGLPAELMRRAGANLNDLDATLAFTRGVLKHEFRDHCNAVWATSGQVESKHRATERAVGCGWFDWFVQLFRQTWTGQVEILSRLRERKDPVAILPWDHDCPVGTLLAEGFPGASLRLRGLSAEGYKHPGDLARGVRAGIVAGLVARGLPLAANVSAEAIADSTGDLIDALVMLLAGRDALAMDHAAICAELPRHGLLGEGWIYR